MSLEAKNFTIASAIDAVIRNRAERNRPGSAQLMMNLHELGLRPDDLSRVISVTKWKILTDLLIESNTYPDKELEIAKEFVGQATKLRPVDDDII